MSHRKCASGIVCCPVQLQLLLLQLRIYESVGEIQLLKSLGLNQLAKRTTEKGALLTQATKLAVDLKNNVEN